MISFIVRLPSTACAIVHEYDSFGNLTKATNPLGYTVRQSYDKFNRVVEIRDEVGDFVKIGYDDFSNVITLTDAIGHIAQYEYDVLHRITKIIEPDGTYTEYGYDAESNIIRFRDRLGFERHYRYFYDAPIEVRLNNKPEKDLIYRYEYDTEQNLIGVYLPDGATMRFEYDERNRVSHRTMQDGTQVDFNYDSVGNLVEVRTGSEYVHYEYDEANNLVAKVGSNGEQVKYEYDAFSRVIHSEYGKYINELEYDPFGRLVRETANDMVLEYQYDATGERSGIAPSIGRAIHYQSMPRGGISRIEVEKGGFVQYHFDSRGRITRREQGNGLSEERAWDSRDRMVLQKLKGHGNNALFQRTYAYDAESNFISRRDTKYGEVKFGFGPQGWIEAQQSTMAWPETGAFAYDALGNTISMPNGRSAKYDRVNRIIVDGEYKYEYDALGRMTGRIDRHGQKTAFSYDLNDQVTRIEHPDGHTTIYEYDAFGRRVFKEHCGQHTRFQWDGNFLFQEWSEDVGVICHQYVMDPYRIAPVMQITWNNDSNEQPDDIRYCHTDHVGSVTELSGNDGSLKWSAEYDAFGKIRIHLGDPGMIRLRRPGQYYDDESGFYYNRYRYYDSGNGRFTTPDPVDIVAGFNLYKYPTNPLSVIDLNGLGITPVPGVHSFVDTNYLSNLLNSVRRNDTTNAVFQHASANRDRSLISPRAYEEFIGQDPNPQTRLEKQRLLKKFGINKSNPLCSRAKQERYKQLRSQNMANGMDENDSAIAAYAAANDCPIITNNVRDFRRAVSTTMIPI